MTWGSFLHQLIEPAAALGSLMTVRAPRSHDQSSEDETISFSKKLALAVLGSIFPVVVSTIAAFSGTYLALRLDIQGLHAADEQIRHDLASQLRELRTEAVLTTSLRENQMATFTKQCSDTQQRLGAFEARIQEIDRELTRVKARDDLRTRR